MPDKCVVDSERDCLGRQRADEVSGEAKAKAKALEERLEDLRRSTASTNQRFGERIGELEAANKVRDVEIGHLNRRLDEIDKDMTDHHQEQKDSIAELRREHKESMEELKKGNKDILDIIAPLRQKADNVEKLEKDVEQLKGKPAETWEHIKKQGLGWIVALALALLAAALGLSKYL